jgi:Spy/CpxP family protein refolding chaperone
MKKALFLLTLAAAITCPALAQTGDTTSDPGYTTAAPKKVMSPTQRAAHQLNVLQQKLNLNQDQVIQLRMILLNLNVSLDSLRSNPSGDKKVENKARRTITQEADGKIYALLTVEQQLQYAQWKNERKHALQPASVTPPQQP